MDSACLAMQAKTLTCLVGDSKMEEDKLRSAGGTRFKIQPRHVGALIGEVDD